MSACACMYAGCAAAGRCLAASGGRVYNPERVCVSCGMTGHWYENCGTFPFVNMVAAAFGLPPLVKPWPNDYPDGASDNEGAID